MELDFLEFDQEDRLSDDEDESEEAQIGNAESKAFWEAQHSLVHQFMCRSSIMERRIWSDTEDVLTRMRADGIVCSCPKERSWCRTCVLRDVADRLMNVGYNSSVCKSKWSTSLGVPPGEHSYIDVVVEVRNGKIGPIRVVIELNFRSEFEMVRASDGYNSLVSRLPVVFVGKSERLRNLIKIMCSAAKKSVEENKMHMPPWRKYKYMQSKWLGTWERTWPTLGVGANVPDRQPVPARTSTLTLDLQHCTAVKVV